MCLNSCFLIKGSSSSNVPLFIQLSPLSSISTEVSTSKSSVWLIRRTVARVHRLTVSDGTLSQNYSQTLSSTFELSLRLRNLFLLKRNGYRVYWIPYQVLLVFWSLVGLVEFWLRFRSRTIVLSTSPFRSILGGTSLFPYTQVGCRSHNYSLISPHNGTVVNGSLFLIILPFLPVLVI